MYLDDEGCLGLNVHGILRVVLLMRTRALKLVNEMGAGLPIPLVMLNDAVPTLTDRPGRGVHAMTKCLGIVLLYMNQSLRISTLLQINGC